MTKTQFQSLLAELAQVRQVAKQSSQGVQDLRHHVDASMVEVRREAAETRDQLRLEMAETRGEMRRHFEVVAEDLRGQIQLLAEGFSGLRELIEAGRRETADGLADLRALIRVSYADLDQRVSRLESADGAAPVKSHESGT